MELLIDSHDNNDYYSRKQVDIMRIIKFGILILFLIVLVGCKESNVSYPVILINGNLTVYQEYGTEYIDLGASCTNDDGQVCKVMTSILIDTDTLGTYHITYSAINSSNKRTVAVRTVEVVDSLSPEISLNGEYNVYLDTNGSYIEFGALVVDGYSSNIDIVIEGEVNTSIIGIYYITYNAIDESGNNAEEVIRTVHVVNDESRIPNIESYVAYQSIESVGIRVDYLSNIDSLSLLIVEVIHNDIVIDTKVITNFISSNVNFHGLESNIDYRFKVTKVYLVNYDEVTVVVDSYISGTLSRLPSNFEDDLGLEKYEVLYNLVYLPYENYNEGEVLLMLSRLASIDSTILAELIGNDVTVQLSNNNITSTKEYMYLANVTPRGWEATGLTWDDIPGVGGNPVVARIGYSQIGHGSINLELHEIAHAIDLKVYHISSSIEFLNAMRLERYDMFGSDSYFAYEEEYFAESFAYYHLNSTTRTYLLENAPLTYEIIANIVDLYQ